MGKVILTLENVGYGKAVSGISDILLENLFSDGRIKDFRINGDYFHINGGFDLDSRPISEEFSPIIQKFADMEDMQFINSPNIYLKVVTSERMKRELSLPLKIATDPCYLEVVFNQSKDYNFSVAVPDLTNLEGWALRNYRDWERQLAEIAKRHFS